VVTREFVVRRAGVFTDRPHLWHDRERFAAATSTMIPLAFAGSALVSFLLAATPAQDARDTGPARIDVSGYPAAQQRSYLVFADKCAHCHPLARSVNARFSSTDWKRYMKRVIRRPSADISDTQAVQIYEFLKYYSGQLGIKD
jgi:hypothetical protein